MLKQLNNLTKFSSAIKCIQIFAVICINVSLLNGDSTSTDISKSSNLVPKENHLTTNLSPVNNFDQTNYPNLWNYTGKMLLVLILIITIILIGRKILKGRLLGGGNINSSLPIKVLSNHYLGPKHKIVLIAIHDKYLLLGITDQSISLIKEYESDDKLFDSINTGETSGTDFLGVLKSVFKINKPDNSMFGRKQ